MIVDSSLCVCFRFVLFQSDSRVTAILTVIEIRFRFIMKCKVGRLLPNEMSNGSQIHVRIEWLQNTKHNKTCITFIYILNRNFVRWWAFNGWKTKMAFNRQLNLRHCYKIVQFYLPVVFVSPLSYCHSDLIVSCC